MRPTSARAWISLVGRTLPWLILAGCGTAAYHDRMEAQLKKLRELEAALPTVNLSQFYQYIQEPHLHGEKRVNLRIPRCFTRNDQVFHEQEIVSRSNKSYLPPRLWPLGVEIPGYYWTYEASVAEGATRPQKLEELEGPLGKDKRWSYSFAFGAIRATPSVAKHALESYLQELNTALANTTGANRAQIEFSRPELIKEVEIENQQKEQTRWKFFRQEADMFFTSFEGRQEQTWEKKPGVLEIYATYHNQHLVILAGVWMKELENATQMNAYLPVIASTVTLKGDASSADE